MPIARLRSPRTGLSRKAQPHYFDVPSGSSYPTFLEALDPWLYWQFGNVPQGLQQALEAYYEFEEASGNLTDSTGSGNSYGGPFSLSGTCAYRQAGKIGYSVGFNGGQGLSGGPPCEVP